MKHKTLFPRPIPVLASLLLTMLCAIGCTQEDPSEFPGTNPNDSDEPIPVTIAFNGVETMFGPYGAETRNLQANKIHFSQEYDKTRMIETIVMAEPDTLQVPLDPSTRGQLASTSLRIVAYDVLNKAYQGTGVFNIDEDGIVTPNSDETLTLKQGQYIFHCFSPAGPIVVNDTKTTATVTLPSAGGTVDPMSYYAKTGKVTVVPPTNEGTSSVAIPSLKPQYCKLTLEATAPVGNKVTYESAELTTTLYKGATLALPGGKVTGDKSSPSTTTIVSDSPAIYTYPGITGAFTITLTNVKVNDKPKDIGILTSGATGLTMKVGYAYKVNVKLDKKKNWIQIANGLKVARGNLIGPVAPGGAFNKNKNDKPNDPNEVGWAIGPDQGWYSGVGNGGDYFNWGVRDPLCTGGNTTDYYNDALDSCPWGPTTDSYPSGIPVTEVNPCWSAMGDGWHVPTTGELMEMMRVTVFGQYYSESKGETVKGRYLGTTNPVVESDQDKYPFLPFPGMRGSTGTVAYYEEGNYWTARPYKTYTNQAVAIHFLKTIVDEYGNWNILRYTGLPIRCVSN